MQYYPGTTNSGTIMTSPSPASYLGGLVTQQLARACVVSNVYTPNNSQPNFIGHNPMTETELNQVVTSGRDIYGNSQGFWTIRIVMTSTFGDWAGAFGSPSNTTIICYEYTKTQLKLWKNNYTQSELETAVRRTLLHELAHVLIDDAENKTGQVRKQSIEIEDTLLPFYQQFALEDIKDIQYYSRAQN